jgi:hypothetical protein
MSPSAINATKPKSWQKIKILATPIHIPTCFQWFDEITQLVAGNGIIACPDDGLSGSASAMSGRLR